MPNTKSYTIKDSALHEVTEATVPYDKLYSYADYFSWKFQERVELIKGKIFKMSPGPNRLHQSVSSYVSGKMFSFLEQKFCKLYTAPFDVRFITKSPNDEDVYTVLQPDICVICDKSKLDDRGCLGAPDLVVEILSPSTSRKDLTYKYDIYESHGVSEYWVVHPTEQTLLIYTLKEGKSNVKTYVPSRLFVKGDIVRSEVLSGFELNLEEVFNY